jgi:hypothetical protein
LALGECGGEQDALAACMLGAAGGTDGTGDAGDSEDPSDPDDDDDSGGTTSDDDDEDEDDTDGIEEPCDPVLDPACVGCGMQSCGAPDQCCWDGSPMCVVEGACGTNVTASCDGSEDCEGGRCCVSMSVSATGGDVEFAEAACTPGGGSACCTGTPGVAGCAADPSVEACVCAVDDWCCNMEWDPECVALIEQLGCGTCAAGCNLSNGSTGSGYSIHSIACRTSADCAGLTGNFGVPYGSCCTGVGYEVGACVSQTFEAAIVEAGGSCH